MIRIKGIEKKFNEETDLKFKDLTFEDGKSYVILGPSGSGKSTLLNIISGIISQDKGTVEIDNIRINEMEQTKKDKFRLDNIGYIFQDYKLIDEMTVEDNIKMLKIEGIDCSNMEEVLNRVGILNKKKQKVSKLSGGEKQRVAIARALIKKPTIILADEPTQNLNFEIGEEVTKLIIAKNKEEKTVVIMVTHDERLTKHFDVVIKLEDFLQKGGNANA